MRALPLLVLLLPVLIGGDGLGAAGARPAAQTTKTALTRLLGAELDQFPARTSIYVKHLKTGEEATVRADDSFNSQSVIKVPIMVRAFQLAEAGKLQLDERVTLGRADLRDGTGVFQYADLGLAPTVRDLIQQMIITSDNTATDQITTKVGGVDALNGWLAQAGYRMRMLNRGDEYRRKLLARLDPRLAAITAEETTGLHYALSNNPVFELYRPLFTGERASWVDVVRSPANRLTHAANQRKLMVEDRNYWLGDISAREIGRMLEGIERDTAASPASCATMRLFLRRQLAGSRRLPHFVDVPVAHKTGDSANIANDVGILYARSGPIVIAVMATGITGSYGDAEDRIGRIAKLVVDHFDGPTPGGASEAAQLPTRKRVIQPPGYKPTPSPLSPGILVGETLYLSGSTGGDPVTGQLVKGGFEPEMRQIMANVQTVLAAADMTLTDVVSVTAYLADMSDFARFNEIYKEFFSATPLPTRSTVAVKGLARDARLELTMTAVRAR
ncbi:MAG: serine hydrolase [Acidobacteria bacterium]|nr:serine hydrolase [Acidobacteriota bacterium]